MLYVAQMAVWVARIGWMLQQKKILLVVELNPDQLARSVILIWIILKA